MPLIAALKNTLFAVFLAMILGLVAIPTASAASHLPDCKANSKCLMELGGKWFSITIAEVQMMIDNGADVNATNYRGMTPLDLAYANGHAEIIKLLETAGGKRGKIRSGVEYTKKTKYERKYERKRLSPDNLVQYNFVYKPQCQTRRNCVVIEAKAMQGCLHSLYMSLILFDGQKRNIGFTNAVAHDLRKGESALLEFSIIEKNAASYRVGKINCHQ